MSYYFPSPVTNLDFPKAVSPVLSCTFNSGKDALRALLKSFGLPAGSKVAIPAYVCSDVKKSVEAESLLPVMFDLKDDMTFWTGYSAQRMKEENIKVLVLVHMYGFIHPDTEPVCAFCKANSIRLIHDAAQSFGIDESRLSEGDGIIYSFGPGKSTSAAGGGWLKTKGHGCTQIPKKKPRLWHNRQAKYFFKSRLYGFKFSKAETLIYAITRRIGVPGEGIHGMTAFQKQAASFCLSALSGFNQMRRKRYDIIREKLLSNTHFLFYDDHKGSYFKAVLYVKTDAAKFRQYLHDNQVPYYSPFDEHAVDHYKNLSLPNFHKNAAHFVEISTEASLPEEEIKRVAEVIAAY